jgi:hypothetical protein
MRPCSLVGGIRRFGGVDIDAATTVVDLLQFLVWSSYTWRPACGTIPVVSSTSVRHLGFNYKKVKLWFCIVVMSSSFHFADNDTET